MNDGATGVFSPVALDFTGETSLSFTYTPTGKGQVTLTATPDSAEPATKQVQVSADSYTITGPVTGLVGEAETYTLTPNGPWSGTLTLTDGMAETDKGTFTPPVLTFEESSDPQTFVYTPAVGGNPTLRATSTPADGGWATLAGEGFLVVVPSLDFGLSGPDILLDGVAATFKATFAGPYTGTVTLETSGTGAFAPETLEFTGQASQTFTYTPSGKGIQTLTATPPGPLEPATKQVTVSADAYSITGPTEGETGVTESYELTPNGPWSGTLTLSDGLPETDRGTFTPPTLTFTGDQATQYFTYTPALGGNPTLRANATPSDGGWAVLAGPGLTVAIPYADFEISGPPVLLDGVPATFKATFGLPFTGTVTLDDGDTGSFDPSPLVFAGERSRTFTYTPATKGIHTLEASPDADVEPATKSVSVSADAYEITGPATGEADVPSSFMFVPNGPWAGTVVLSDGLSGDDQGVFTPASLTFEGEATPEAFTYTPAIRTVLTITGAATPEPEGWATLVGVGHVLTVPATELELTGPSALSDGVAATFTLSFNGPYTGSVALDDGTAGGAFSPGSVTFTGQSTSTFTYTPDGPGEPILTATPDGEIAPATKQVTISADSYVISGPALGVVGESADFTFAPNGPWSGVVELSDGLTGADAGVFSPSTLIFDGAFDPVSFTYTPAVRAVITISALVTPSDGGWGTLAGTGVSFMVPATAVDMVGPSVLLDGVPTTFTVAFNGPYVGSVGLSDDSAGGAFSPTSLTFDSEWSLTFDYTPSGKTDLTLTATPDGFEPVSLPVTVSADEYEITGPATGLIDEAATYTLTINGPWSGRLTLSDGLPLVDQGTFSPAIINYAGDSDPVTFSYTPRVGGERVLEANVAPSSGGWAGLSGGECTVSVALADFGLTGPSLALLGETATFTVSFAEPYTGTVEMSDGAGGLFVPEVLTFAGETSKSSDYTPSARGNQVVTATPSHTFVPLTRPVMVPAESFTIQGSASGKIGSPVVLTVAVDGPWAGSLSLSDGLGLADAGVFLPGVLTYSGEASSKTFTYTPKVGGTIEISATSAALDPMPELVGTSASVTIPASSLVLQGPAVVWDGVTETYSAVFNGPFAGSVVLSDGGEGVFVPPTLTLSGEASSTFTYTPSGVGSRTLQAMPSGGLSSASLLVSVPGSEYAITGPASGPVGASLAFKLAVNGPWSGTVTLSDGLSGSEAGIFDPAVIVFDGDSLPKSFTYIPVSGGVVTLSGTGVEDAGYPPLAGDGLSVGVLATSFIVSGPETGELGVPVEFMLTPNGLFSGSVTVSASPGYGTFEEEATAVVGFDEESVGKPVFFTPSRRGMVLVTATAVANSGKPMGQASAVLVVPAGALFLTCPDTATAGVPVHCKLTVDGPYSGTVELSDGMGGTVEPATLVVDFADAIVQDVFYTPPLGEESVILTASTLASDLTPGTAELEVRPPPPTADEISLTGPTVGVFEEVLTYSVQPNAAYEGSVALTAVGDGTLSVDSLTWSGGAAAQTFTYTLPASGAASAVITATPSDNDAASPPESLDPVSVTVLVQAGSFSIVGDAEVPVGEDSTFELVPDGLYSGSIALSDASGVGVFEPAVVEFTGVPGERVSFTYRPGASGTETLVGTSMAPSIGTASLALSIPASTFVVTGPDEVEVGSEATYVVTPDGPYVGAFTVKAVGAGGVLSDTALVMLPGDDSVSFTYTPSAPGLHTVSVGSVPGLTPADVRVLVTVPASGWTLMGPADAGVGKPVMYTLSVDGPYSGVLRVSDDSGGSFSQTDFVFTGIGAESHTFTYKAAMPGWTHMTASAVSGLDLSGADVLISVQATGITLTAANKSLEVGDSTTITITPNGPYSGTITLTDPIGQGKFTVDGVTTPLRVALPFTSTVSSREVTYTANQRGSVIITGTGNPVLTSATVGITVAAGAIVVTGLGPDGSPTTSPSSEVVSAGVVADDVAGGVVSAGLLAGLVVPALAPAGVSDTPREYVAGVAYQFTVTPDGPFVGRVYLSVEPAGGVLSPSYLDFVEGQTSASFTFTPSTTGSFAIHAEASGLTSAPFQGSARPQPPAGDEISMTGPQWGGRGETLKYTIQPTGPYVGEVTLSDRGVGGVFSVPSLTWAGDNAPKSFTYIPAAGGEVYITATATINTFNGANLQIASETLNLAVPAISYTITTTATEAPVGVPITYTITPDGVYTGMILLIDFYGLAEIEPMVVTFDRGETSKTFTYTAHAAGDNGIMGISMNPSILDDVASVTTWASDVIITGPTQLAMGQPAASFFATPDGPWAGGGLVISQTPANGTLTPPDGVVTLPAGDSPSVGFSWKPDQPGRTVIAATAPGGVYGSTTVITPATAYDVTHDADMLVVGEPIEVTIAPNGPWQGQISLFADNATIAPDTVLFTYADGPITVILTPTAAGPLSLTSLSYPSLGTDPEWSQTVALTRTVPTTTAPPPPPTTKPAPPPTKPAAPPTKPAPPPTPPDPTASAVRAAVTKINLQAGKAAKVTLITDPGPGQAGATSILVKNSNPNAVTATFPGGSAPVVGQSNGKVVLGAAVVLNLKAAKKPGKSAVSVTIGGKAVTIAVTVVAKAVKTTKATIKGKKKMKVGTKMLLKAGAVPPKSTGAVPKWKSSKKKFASVDATGQVTALAAGTTVVTATVNGKKAALTIQITK
ncbi:MAG: hypothetical protein FWD59_02760 [Micrococcales bacterium]|nr:hypothetical protein [Micrococcales bacterium]